MDDTQKNNEASDKTGGGRIPVDSNKKHMTVNLQEIIQGLIDYLLSLQEQQIITLTSNKDRRIIGKRLENNAPKLGIVSLGKGALNLVKSAFDHMGTEYKSQENKEERNLFVRTKKPVPASGGYINILVLLGVILLSSLVLMLIIK